MRYAESYNMASFQTVGRRPVGAALLHGLVVPWDGFVVAFLYYVGLTLLAIGVANLPGLFIAVAYLLPVAAYIGLLVMRAVRALAALPIDLGETPHALQH
jgi:hypothetical protein